MSCERNKPQVRDEKLATLAPIVGVVTTQQISNEMHLNSRNTRAIRAHIKVSGVTQVGTLTLRLRGRVNPSESFANFGSANSSATFTANGTVILKLSDVIAGDQADVPFFPHVILALTTTNAGDRVTVDNVWFEYL